MNRIRCHLACWAVLLVGPVSWSAEMRSEHTYALEPDEARPAATLEDARWLVGAWTGTAFGQNFEAVWNAPSAGSMVGLFKLHSDDGVSFYELLQLRVVDGTLSLKVKHFNADFTAWEEKSDFVDFRLVKVEDKALHFGGLSFYRREDGSMDGYIVMRNDDGLTEHHLKYERAKQ